MYFELLDPDTLSERLRAYVLLGYACVRLSAQACFVYIATCVFRSVYFISRLRSARVVWVCFWV